MKKLIFALLIVCLVSAAGYTQKEFYTTTGGEMIFSFANVDYDGTDGNVLMRWAPVINLHSYVNYDLGKNVGLFTGLGFRNVGYILNNYVDREGYQVKKKFRTYNIAIPVGLKIGNMEKMFVYVGYDFEFPFHYKEKTFKDENKTINAKTFFSKRVEQFQHGIIVGVQFPYGVNLKFKYYFSEFHNEGYTESDGYMPYAGLKSNVFYFSLNFNMFKDSKLYY